MAPEARMERLGPWVVRCSSDAAGESCVRLLCFPHAGGSASAYVPLARLLGAEIEVLAVQLPGREQRVRERLCTRAAPLIEAMVDAVPGGVGPPYAVLGHSLGALLAFAYVGALRARGLPLPIRLFVSGCRPPQVLARQRGALDLSDDGLLTMLRRHALAPPEVLKEPEFLAMLLPILRADLMVYNDCGFETSPPVSCPITAMGGAEDDDVAPEVLPMWGAYTTAGIETRIYPGSHFFIRSAAHAVAADSVRTLLTDVLDRTVHLNAY